MKKLVPLFLLIGASSFLLFTFNDKEGDVLKVVFLDVGQGDAIYIESPSEIQVLIDAGPDGSVVRELSSVMPFYDRSIDIALLTHPDKDHMGGFPDVFEAYVVSSVLDNGVVDDSGIYDTYVHAIETEGAIHRIANAGQIYDLGGGAFMEILFPDRQLESSIEKNTSSVVVRIVYGENEFLFTGDSPKAVERYLVSLYGDALHSDVLKAGHHGSKTSSDEVFLAHVSPGHVAISAGQDNTYGHPHKETLSAIAGVGALIDDTREGGVVFYSDGERVWED